MKTAPDVRSKGKKAPPKAGKAGRGRNVPQAETPRATLEKRILLMAPTGNDAKLTSQFIAKAGYAVEACWEMKQVCAKIKEGCGIIVLAEEAIGADSLPQLMGTLKEEPSWSDIPLILITGGDEKVQRSLRRLAASGPASEVSLLVRPFHPQTLLSTVEVAMHSRVRQYQVRDLLATQRAGEQRLQGILESISDAFVALDRDWRFTYVNKSYMELVSPLYSEPEDLIGRDLWERFPDILGTKVELFYRRVMETQKMEILEYFFAPLNRWLEIHAHPSPEVLSLYINDATQRKNDEQQLRDLTLKIGEQARIFDTTLSHIADFAYTFDREGRFIYVNKPLLDLWGLTLDQAAGKNFHELNYPGELAARLQQQIQQVIETCAPVRDETAYTNHEGKTGYYEYIFSPVLDVDGEVEVVAGSTRLITERKRNEALLREAKEAAEAANMAKDRFLAVLSHELRTPLTPVLMTVASMEADPLLPAETRENLAMIRRNVELETKLIDDLLDLSRVAAGKLALHSELLDLNTMVRHVHSICGSQIAEKEIEFHCDCDAEAGFVFADPARFRQVLWNLFSNAVKFTPRNGRVYVSTARLNANRVQIAVRDDGIGIPGEMLPRIFDAFEQGDGAITRQFGGLGLGLAICKALVEMHGGTIRAESRGKDEGSAFFIELPRAEAPAHAAAAVAPEQDGPPAGRVRRLLVVEDHRDTANALARLLRRSGYTVETAFDIADALGRAKNTKFDLVLSDLGLPDGDGYELMRWLRERGDGIKGIAMSGYGMDEDIRKSREAGFSEHLVKPVNAAHLRDAIRRVIENGN